MKRAAPIRGRGRIVGGSRHRRHPRERLIAVAVRQHGPQIGAGRRPEPDDEPARVEHVCRAAKEGRQVLEAGHPSELGAEV